MNSTSEERFYFLAMKEIGHRCSADELNELRRDYLSDTKWRNEFIALKGDAIIVKTALTVFENQNPGSDPIPKAIRERLHKKVHEQFPDKPTVTLNWARVIPIIFALGLLVWWFIPTSNPKCEFGLVFKEKVESWDEINIFEQFVRKEFNSLSIIQFKADSPELQDWRGTRDGDSVKITVTLDRTGRSSILGLFGTRALEVQSIEVIGQKRDNTFQRSYSVKTNDWRSGMVETKHFVHEKWR